MQATACSRTGVKVMDAVKFARQLRRNESKAETIFWNAVRNRQFLNLKFRRQVPIDKYFADFVCEEKKIIIELDDIGHDQKIVQDKARTEVLARHGYRVIRFANEEIYEDLDAVLAELSLEI